MSAGVPLTARTLAQSNHNDLQRTAHPNAEINERRLRPIYDLMEIHNYRKALTEIDRLLKRQANFTACKALKCLVLSKLERYDDARALVTELEALALSPTRNAPTGDAANMDENALTFLSQYYKDLRQYDKAVNLYEAACKREPNSEELHCSLFMAYVRMKDYKNQTITAQKLYKLTRKAPYYNWAVNSVLLQIDENSPQLKQTLYIPMALKMLEKEFFDENLQSNKHYGEIECLLYLHALELKEDFNKALTFLNNHLEMLTKAPSNESMLPAYFSHEKQLIYHFKANQLEKTYQLAKDFLREDNYLWNWYEVLFDTFFRFDATKQEELVQDLHEFILAIPDAVVDPRALHLSRIELGLRWRDFQRKNPSSTLPALASSYLTEKFFSQITSYIDTYAKKTTALVMYDIYRVMEYLSAEERSRLHTYLIDQITANANEDHLQELINLFYCARLCAEDHRPWLMSHGQIWIERLLSLAYQSNTPPSIGVELLLLVASIIDETDRSKMDLYGLLERTYERDPAHFDVKLYLYKIALDFNGLGVMKEIFEKLEIKNIQHFSLAYCLTDHYLRIHTNYRQVRNLFQYLSNLLFVYTDDSWSQIMFCYKYGNFLRINEIRTFSDSYLSFSLIYFQSMVGSIVVNFIQQSHRYASIGTVFKSSSNRILFDQHLKTSPSVHDVFYKNNQIRLQDTRDFDIWPKVDHRRLRFDVDQPASSEYIPYADRILTENAGSTVYRSPSYKDSFLRQQQSTDFQQRVALIYLRTTILHLFQTLHNDAATTSTNNVVMPDEKLFETLKKLNEEFDRCVQSINVAQTITPCELQSIVDLELYRSIPWWIRLLVDGITWNSSSEASATSAVLSLTNVKVQFDQIESAMTNIIKQLERSYQLLEEKLAKRPMPERVELEHFSGSQAVLELYSVYTEFISYIHAFHLTIRSIFASLFNKTALLVDPSDSANARSTTTKKSKKKAADQGSASTGVQENEAESKLWNAFEKIEHLFDHQWTQITGNIRKYEELLRQQDPSNQEDYERFAKEFEMATDSSSAAKAKGKHVDENHYKSESLPAVSETGDQPVSSSSIFELGKTSMRPSTMRYLVIGYLESFMQLRVTLMNKQKTLRLSSTTSS